MALRSKIVDLVGAGFLNDANQIGGIGYVSEMQEQLRVGPMRILVEMVNAAGIE